MYQNDFDITCGLPSFIEIYKMIELIKIVTSYQDYLFGTLKAPLFVRALSESDLIRTTSEFSGRTLTVFVATFSVRSVGRGLSVGATSETKKYACHSLSV